MRDAEGNLIGTQPPLDPKQYRTVVRERWSIPLRVRNQVLRRDRGECRYCYSRDELTIDHVVPVALGGSNRVSNLVTACSGCNGRKGAAVWFPRPRR